MATNWTGINDMNGLLGAANTNSGGWFWLGMLFMAYVVMIVSMLGFGLETAVLASSFAALIIGLILVSLGLVAWTYVAGFIGVIVLLIFWITYTRPKQ